MDKIRRCRYCMKSIHADWPRLKTFCDNPECVEKHRVDVLAEMKVRSKTSYDKRKAKRNAGRVCEHCGGKIPLRQRISIPVCLKKECIEWLAAKKYEKKLKRQRDWYAREQALEKKKPEPKKDVFVTRPDDFTQEKFIEKLKSHRRLNGHTCLHDGCDVPTTGNYRFCEKHRRENFRIDGIVADVDVENSSRRAFEGFR